MTGGRTDLPTAMIKTVERNKSELALIRRRTVEKQGHYSFKEPIVLRRAAEGLPELSTPDMDAR